MDENNVGGGAAPTGEDPAPVADKNTGIVAIDSGEHAEAKSVFASIRSKIGEVEAEFEAELKKLETLLHL